MRTYNKRIGFLVSYQTLIPHGGIGQFTLSFVRMMHNRNIKVDLITDKLPDDTDFINELKSLGASIITPSISLPYSKHSAIFMYGDSFCYERMINFRNSLLAALEKNLYDMLICNTYETVQVASTMGLEECIQILAYTHLESQIFTNTSNPFLHNVNVMMRKQLELDGITVGTQSSFNARNIEGSIELPIPFTEPDLLIEHHKPREGVLFIGRWEEGKNPDLYIDLIKQTNLPAKIMTNSNGAKKFEKAFEKMGYSNYVIKTEIIGKEKVDFITSAKVAFNPSTIESFGIAFWEQTAQLPTLALEGMRWLNNFDPRFHFTTTKKKMAEDCLSLYKRFETAKDWYDVKSIEWIKQNDDECFLKWFRAMNDFPVKQSRIDTAAICKEKTVKYVDFIKGLERNTVCIDDFKSVLSNRHKFRVIYTDQDTYLTKDPNFVPESDEHIGTSLFEGFY